MRPPLLLLAAALTACQPSGGSGLTVAVATDLAPWAEANLAPLSEALGAPVTVVSGPSGQLVAQRVAGAPFDLILSADAATLDRLPAAGPCRHATARSFATGSLGIALSRAVAQAPTVASLASSRVATIAIANPTHAPYGALAERYLDAHAEAPELRPKLVFANSAADAAAWVEQGAADAAVTAWSLIAKLPEARRAKVAEPGHALAATGIVCGARRGLDKKWYALTAAPWFADSLRDAGFGPPP